jgi:putative CocE/NonD family hydrolase
LYGGSARYWQEIVDHTTYDDFWKPRSLWKHMKNISCAVLNVGGWYDAEDPMGPFHIYRAVEKNNPATVNVLAMGPWEHAGWGWGRGDSLGNLGFGVPTAEEFRQNVEFPFFMKYLKDARAEIAEATMFLTGIDEFRRHSSWPPSSSKPRTFYLAEGGRISATPPAERDATPDRYVSDPNRPVPYIEKIVAGMTGDYMTEDQRFASRRPDVLVYRTEPLEADLTVAGPIRVTLHVATTGTDADFVVKLIDEYPSGPGQPRPANGVVMEGYQRLVRGEPFRGKYRNSLERPEPFVPGEPAVITFEMPDVYHAFRRGHRLMVHIQSSWFPLVDRNPQQFMEIPKARKEDFRVATQSIFRSADRPSSITLLVSDR